VRHPAMDMWSLGVIIYELYTGHRLFDASVSEHDVAAQLAVVRITLVQPSLGHGCKF
jgi:serine/threonine protein kinase